MVFCSRPYEPLFRNFFPEYIIEEFIYFWVYMVNTEKLCNEEEPFRQTEGLAEVFRDAGTHREVARIIQAHLTNPRDIRQVALEGLDLSKVGRFVDLGCGFGYFTRGLRGRLSSSVHARGIDRHPGYKDFYMKACDESGFQGEFCSEDISIIRKINTGTIDLVICSFALYFFPEQLRHISRILKHDGLFVTITHSMPHMNEFTSVVKEILSSNGIEIDGNLPYEKLIAHFSNVNGISLLSNWFSHIESRDYSSSISFGPNDMRDFETYFRFKQSFFLPESGNREYLVRLVLEDVGRRMTEKGCISITKDDIIFICGKPVQNSRT